MADGIASGQDRPTRALLLTGLYGAGKSTVAVELADLLQAAGEPFAAIDLDWLWWFHVKEVDENQGRAVLHRNLESLGRTYRAVGVRSFVLAFAVRDHQETDALARALHVTDLRIVRLVASLPEIRRRLVADLTRSRLGDLRVAETWHAEGIGDGVEDLTIDNEAQPVRQVAQAILDWTGWLTPD